MLSDLVTVLRVAEGGEWFAPVRDPVATLAAALPDESDPDAVLFRSWLPHAEDAIGQVALALHLIGRPLTPEMRRLGRLLSYHGSGDARLDALARDRLRQVERFERFSPWSLAEAFALVDGGRLTQLGALMLRVSERDQLELLLAIGTVLATDFADRWMLSVEALTVALGGSLILEGESPESVLAADGWTVATALGAITRTDDEARTWAELRQPQRERIAQIVDGTSPVLAVVRVLLDDRRSVALGLGTASAADAFGPFVHGMRNKLRSLDVVVRRFAETAPSPEALTWVQPLAEDLRIRLASLEDVVDRLGGPLAAVAAVRLDLRDIALAAIRELERENGLTVELADGPSGLDVPLDPALVQEVLLELLRNARDAGAKRAWISIAPRSGGGVRLTVRNDGPPIVDPNRVFEEGYSTNPGRRGGGLATARRSLSRAGATLQLDRSAAETSFTLSFPGGR